MGKPSLIQRIARRLISLVDLDRFIEYGFWGGYSTKAGTNVNENIALTYSAVWACVRILSNALASLPLPLYRNIQPRGKIRAIEHPLYDILHNRVNPNMSSYIWRQTMMSHILTWGNGYSFIDWGRDGWAKGLYLMRPDRTEPILENGELRYKYKQPNGEDVYYQPYQILHIPGLGFDGVKGYSVITYARESIGLGMAAEEFGARFFGNGSHFGGIVEYPGKLSDKAFQRYKEDIRKGYAGLGKSHQLLFLEEGMKFHGVTIPPNDAQFLETRKFQIAEIARWYGVPLHMLAELDRATFSNIEQQSLEFVIHSLRPWLVNWEQQINYKLLLSDERKQYQAEFVVEGLLRGDATARSQFYREMFNIGAMSQNDIREKENMNPIPGGDKYFVPLNMVPSDMVEDVINDDNDDGRTSQAFMETRAQNIATGRNKLAKTFKPVFRDAAARVVKREVNDLKRAIEKHLGKRDQYSFLEWMEEYYQDHPDFIERQMLPVLVSYAGLIQEDAAKEIGMDPDEVKDMDLFVRSYLTAFTTRYILSSKRQLEKIIRDAQTANEDPVPVLEERLTEWEEKRPGKISMRETVQAASAVSIFVYKQGGIRRIRWVARGQSCKFCRNLNGKIIAIEGETFADKGKGVTVDGETLTPRGKVSHAPLHGGCDCVVVAEPG